MIALILTPLFSPPDFKELPAYHPFKSTKAQALYLSHYDLKALKWPAPSETRYVGTSYGRTFVRISGPKGAPVLVLLPGSGCTSLMWLPNIQALSEHFRVFSVDNIYDFGRSVYTRPMKNPEDFAQWLEELFNGLELENNINLGGLSYGGWLTAHYALHRPERLRKIVLLAPAATVLPLPNDWAWRAGSTLIPLRYFFNKTSSWFFADLARQNRPLFDEFAEDGYLGLRCFRLKMPAAPTVLDDKQLRGISVPALFLVGAHEKIYPAQKAIQRLNTAAPGIETRMIPDAGHDLTFVQSELVNNGIIAFLLKP
ncbi:MAG: alpha/beta hydrolase [Desulfobacteraceae bacterium]|nr:MAG: alpha/beta hydrolase [Desulfobacteraceae bacterium]